MISLLGSFSSVMMSFLYIVLAIVILMFMITVHEFGHYTAGKIFKFKIYEFSIGFGKALFKKTKKNGEVFAIRLIPLGGYCAFGEDEEDTDPNAFNNQAWWKRVIVLASGALFNFLSAILFCVILLSVVGSGQSEITSVTPGNTNDLRVGDVVTRIDGKKSTFLNGGFRGLTSKVNDDTTKIVLTVERVVDGKKQTIEVPVYKKLVELTDENGVVITNDDGTPVTGYQIGVTTAYHNFSFGRSLLKAVPFAFELAWECLVILGKLLIGQYGLRDIGGPITTVTQIAKASSQSMLNLLLLIPLIAVNLAVFNLLPIPALDGARIVFVLIEAIRHKPVNKDIEAKIHTVGIIVLFAFVILVDFLQMVVFR